MKRQMFMTIALLFILVAVCSTAFAQKTMQGNMNKEKPMMQSNQNGNMPMTANMTHEDLRVAMRMLWDDHVAYNRNYIISAIAKLGDTDFIAERLMQNQMDIGNAFKPYYGDEAGMQLTNLLKEHVMIAGDVVKYAMNNQKMELDKAQKNWYDNAGKIATLLSKANPNWSMKDCTDMLNQHLAYTTDEVTNRLAKKYKDEIKSYDMGHQHMMMFSDFLTDGIVKQFPTMVSEK